MHTKSLVVLTMLAMVSIAGIAKADFPNNTVLTNVPALVQCFFDSPKMTAEREQPKMKRQSASVEYTNTFPVLLMNSNAVEKITSKVGKKEPSAWDRLHGELSSKIGGTGGTMKRDTFIYDVKVMEKSGWGIRYDAEGAVSASPRLTKESYSISVIWHRDF